MGVDGSLLETAAARRSHARAWNCNRGGTAGFAVWYISASVYCVWDCRTKNSRLINCFAILGSSPLLGLGKRHQPRRGWRERFFTDTIIRKAPIMWPQLRSSCRTFIVRIFLVESTEVPCTTNPTRLAYPPILFDFADFTPTTYCLAGGNIQLVPSLCIFTSIGDHP